VDLDNDYFKLAEGSDGTYSLTQFGRDGTMKAELSGGRVKLANADVAFYIIDGFYATIITRSSEYSYGDRAVFTHLTRDPVLTCSFDICGHIPANRVFDVQWSGNENDASSQSVSGFNAPFLPSTRSRMEVDLDSDYFKLAEGSDGTYSLTQFGQDGTMKAELSGGSLKLANDDVAFYIIDGFYATIITQSREYSYGDSAVFTHLTRDPVLTCSFDVCGGQIPANRVFDVQWSGNENDASSQSVSGLNAPFLPSTNRRMEVDLDSDYFDLEANPDGTFSLKQFGQDGTMKAELSGGRVKLANDDVAFYIIDGWYATIITRSNEYSYGDSAIFTHLTRDPVLSCSFDVCGHVPANRVFDVQWSGNENDASSQSVSGFNAPFLPSTHSRIEVDLDNDYFKLAEGSDGTYSLTQFGRDGTMKAELSGGRVKLANADVAFYIIDGFYATIITRSSEYSYGDRAVFTHLTRDPVLTCSFDICGHIPANRVFDVQWSGNENDASSQSVSGFNAPFLPSTRSRMEVDLDSDYFKLAEGSDGTYSLTQFGQDGTMKAELSGGKVKLANDDVAFYIIDGWYATIITRSSEYSYGDSAVFAQLTRDPVLNCPSGRRLLL